MHPPRAASDASNPESPGYSAYDEISCKSSGKSSDKMSNIENQSLDSYMREELASMDMRGMAFPEPITTAKTTK